jgi:hypothetical protein
MPVERDGAGNATEVAAADREPLLLRIEGGGADDEMF